MMYTPYESMMSCMWPMGLVPAIVLLAVIAAAMGMLVLVTHSRRSFDAPRRTA